MAKAARAAAASSSSFKGTPRSGSSFNAGSSSFAAAPAPSAAGPAPAEQNYVDAQLATNDSQRVQHGSKARGLFKADIEQMVQASRTDLLSGAITTGNVKEVFENLGQRVMQRTQEMTDADSGEAQRLEIMLVEAAQRELQSQLRRQLNAQQAETEQKLQEAEAAAQQRETELAAQIEKLTQEMDKLTKAKDKVERTLQGKERNLKLAGMKAEKDDAELAKLQLKIRAKSDSVMTQVFQELSLPVEQGKAPIEMVRSLIHSHKMAIKELQAEIDSANRTIGKMTADAADGNKHIIEERDVAVQERDASAAALKVAEAARREADEEAERLRKEAKKVRADAKAQAQGEVDRLKAELAEMQNGKEEAEAKNKQVNEKLNLVHKELEECTKALRLARAAGQHGGYYFSASTIREAHYVPRSRSTSPPQAHLPRSPPLSGEIESPEASSGAATASAAQASPTGALLAAYASRMPIQMPLNGEMRGLNPATGSTSALLATRRKASKTKGSKTKRRKAATARAPHVGLGA